MAGNFILDRVKEHFGNSGEDSSDGFDDMNYIIGNSTGMDVGEFPTPLDQRIGYASMTGGSLLELQITNPATFELEGDAMIDVTSQLGVDVTTHPDMNAGFCTAEKSARGEEYGYDTVEQYFTDYLQELAHFKKKVEKLGDNEPLFQIGRMNPHISTSPQPGLAERMANDVGVDPFGFEIADGDKEAMKARSYDGENIWENEEFLRRVYYTFFVEEVDFAFQYYGMFGRYSDKFDKIWEKAQRTATNKFYTHRTEGKDKSKSEKLQDKVSVLRTAQGQDRGIETEWKDIIRYKEVSLPKVKVEVELDPNEDPPISNMLQNVNILDNTETISLSIHDIFGQSAGSFRGLPDIIYNLDEEGEEFLLATIQDKLVDIQPNLPMNLSLDDLSRQNIENIQNKLMQELENPKQGTETKIGEGLDELWTDNGEQKISIDAKIAALDNHFDIEQRRIQEIAYEEGIDGDETLDTHAEKVFMGEPDYYTSEGPEEDLELDKHQELLKNLLQNFEREMWKESNLFYKIMPAWMKVSNEVQNEDHSGWSAPEFIWKTVVEDRWGERDDVDLDLRKPRNGIYEEEGDETYHFLDLLEESDEFQRDVCAAVGACYAWGHYTQRNVQFDLNGRDYGLSDEEVRQVENEGWTWVDWMNRFGLGVNLETMQGSPQMRFKVWRPKDISVTAHAINLTTRRRLDEEGELGGLDHMHDDLDGCPAKFTIDMEHVATLGAPPMKEMELFFDQEERLAEEHPELNINPEKPAAKILRQMHLMDPGVEGQRGTLHGSFERGNKQLYNYLYTFVENGFARNENEPATVLFELAEHNDESSYMMRLAMDLIELGVSPEELDPNNVTPGEEPENEKEALIARYFGMEQVNYNREWAKIEEHAFDPLQGLLEADSFDYTFSSKGAVDQGQNRPGEWAPEEYK